MTAAATPAQAAPAPVTFTRFELLELWEIAQARNNAKPVSLRNRRTDLRLSACEVHYIGLKGERACAKYLGLEVDLGTSRRGVKAPDLIGRVFSYEVKTTSRTDCLYVDADKVQHLKAQALVLCKPLAQGELDPYVTDERHIWRDVELVGWCTTPWFLAQARLYQWRSGDKLVLERAQLWPIEQLLAIEVAAAERARA